MSNSSHPLDADQANSPQIDAICAIVVTFRPTPDVFASLANVRSQAGGLVVVDNGSPADAVAALNQAAAELSFEFIHNHRNCGIAAALNTGVRRALDRGFRWVLLLDQDSALSGTFVSDMRQDFTLHNAQGNLKLLVPRYLDPASGAEVPHLLHDDGGPLVTMTSGSLLPADAFGECGLFEERLFIYTVDDEYSLRLRSYGYSIAQSKRAVLRHAPGSPSRHRFLGRSFLTTNHSPGARYYLNRNRIWTLRRYGRLYPRWALEIVRASLLEFLKIVALETSRWAKVRMIMRGLWDGMFERMGERVAL